MDPKYPDLAFAERPHCDVVHCLEPAAFLLVIPPASHLFQGQAPSPRCTGCAEYAEQVLTLANATFRLTPLVMLAPIGPQPKLPAGARGKLWWRALFNQRGGTFAD